MPKFILLTEDTHLADPVLCQPSRKHSMYEYTPVSISSYNAMRGVEMPGSIVLAIVLFTSC